jgi:hypothetical protein
MMLDSAASWAIARSPGLMLAIPRSASFVTSKAHARPRHSHVLDIHQVEIEQDVPEDPPPARFSIGRGDPCQPSVPKRPTAPRPASALP